MPQYDDLQKSADDRAWADAIANEAYYNALARGSDAATALNSAKFAWQQKMDESAQTGMWNGSYNMPSQQSFANMFGQWMPQGPQAGQQTLTGEQQAYQQAYQNSQLYGQYYAPGTTPTAGMQTQAAQNQQNQLGISQAGLTGYYLAPGQTGQGQQTLQGQAQQWGQGFSEQQFAETQRQNQQSNAQNYLQLLASLRGPADWAKYQQVLGSTPNGMRDLAAAAMGQYVPGGGATTGMQPQAANLQTMQQQVAGQPGQVWGSGIGVGAQQPTPEQQQQGLGGGANTMGQMPAPNQIAAQSWKNMAPSQQQMLLGQYEAQGWDKNDVTSLMNQSLPRYTAGSPGVGSYRLQ